MLTAFFEESFRNSGAKNITRARAAAGSSPCLLRMVQKEPTPRSVHRAPTVGYTYRYPVNETAVVDYILSDYQQARQKRSEERAKLLAAAQERQQHQRLQLQHEPDRGAWATYMGEIDPTGAFSTSPFAGHWPLDLGRADITAADLGLGCEIYLGTDSTCKLWASCWDEESSEGARAELLCNGHWSFELKPHRCIPCIARTTNNPDDFIVNIELEHGEETGVGIAALPLRWAVLPSFLRGSLSLEAMPRGDEPKLILSVPIGGRVWAFGHSRAPAWQDRCAMVGLTTPSDTFGAPSHQVEDDSRLRYEAHQEQVEWIARELREWRDMFANLRAGVREMFDGRDFDRGPVNRS